ncbi:unnamed protein product, partial [Prorocentrum cordatum]
DGGLLEMGTTDAPMGFRATIYIKQCGSLSGPMGSRFVGGQGSSCIVIHGRPLARTMSLLSSGAAQGSYDSIERTVVELLPSGFRVSPPLGAARMGGVKDVEGQPFELAAAVVNVARSVLITGDHQDFLATRQRQCPECILQGSAIVESFQSGITIHGTHRTTVDSNVLWMNRGVGIYTEDGIEMNNAIRHDAIICPDGDDSKRSGGPSGLSCIVKGASAGEGAGVCMVGVTDDVMGNHIAGHHQGLFTPGVLHHLGEGGAQGKVCPRRLPCGITRGSVNRDKSYFGVYPEDQSPQNVGPRDENGYVSDARKCWQELAPDGGVNGVVPASVVEDCRDCRDDFAGQCAVGDSVHLRFKAVGCNAGVALAGRAQLHSLRRCFGSPDLGGPRRGMTCNVQNNLAGLVSATHVCGWVGGGGAQAISFGSSDGAPVRILWVAADESLGGYGAIVSPRLDGLALVPGCRGPLSKWGGGFGRITIRDPGYGGVSRNDSEPAFGANVGSLWRGPPFPDPSRAWGNQGRYA